MNVNKVLKEAKKKMKKAVDVIHDEFATIRTGRASPAIVEGIKVDYYGSSTPLKQLANISVPEPKTIAIQPWDDSSIEAIEKAILKSNIGLTPNNDGKVIRINIPELTKERREELVKRIKKIAEDGKVSIRTVRRNANDKIEEMEDNKELTEDDKYRYEEKIQEITDEHTEKIDKLMQKKKEEITK